MALSERPGDGRERGFDRAKNSLRLAHAAGPIFPAGHVPLLGADEERAVRSQALDVAARRGMKPHAQVHRRREQHALVGGEQQRRREIIGETIGGARQHIRCRRRDDDEIGLARQSDVPHLAFQRRAEEIGMDGSPGKGGEGQLGDEFFARGRQHDAGRSAGLTHPADELERLVGRDPTADDEQNTLARDGSRRLETSHAALPSRSPRLREGYRLSRRVAKPRTPRA